MYYVVFLRQFFVQIIILDSMDKVIVNTSRAPAPVGPYSQAIKVRNTLYVSGQIPINAESGEIVTGDIIKATEQVMKNIWAILNEAGMDFGNVVKCSIFVTNMKDFSLVNAAYGKFFDGKPPVRETVEVAALPKGVDVEISCIAVD
jgi:2-iminobutanoate/2-iminopropanoate deaminase